MSDWAEGVVDVIIEVLTRTRNTYEYDTARALRPDRQLPIDMVSSADDGVVPETLSEEGKPSTPSCSSTNRL